MKSDLPLNVQVSISSISGYVKDCTCSCKAHTLGRCAHITALLLMLSDHVLSEGYFAKPPSTSLPCQWNKGKKRTKTPKTLHEATYKSIQKRPNILYNWDPRPEKYRKNIDDNVTNEFVINLQKYSAEHNELSMWETLLFIVYEDFTLDETDICYYSELVNNFESDLRDNTQKILPAGCFSTKIPGTKQQACSETWHQSRWCRITSSVCKTVTLMGEKLVNYNLSKSQYFNWMKNKFWFPQMIDTFDMQYGISEEPVAVSKYEKVNRCVVKRSGIWINIKYLHLGASPDGLIYDNNNKLSGIIEIKCLKILRKRTVDELVKCVENGELKDVMKHQCFVVTDGTLILRKTHAYYFQVQLQLLITEAEFCDFVLHSGIGNPSMERIYRDIELQERIIVNTKLFWKNLMIPEYFLMRVPRELMPITIP